MIHIVVEGLDGTGKSTLVKSLHEKMLADPSFCRWIYADKEPGLAVNAMAGMSFNRPGIDVRSVVLTDKSLSAIERELMFYVDASQHRRFINNQKDAIIISDRGLWSHYAYLYATMKMKQMTYEEYLVCKQLIKLVCPRPDLMIYLQGDLALMKERNANKTKDLIESNKDEFFEWVSLTYDEYSIEPKGLHALTLDARNSSLQNVETVITYLKEVFTHEELKTGNLSVCGQ